MLFKRLFFIILLVSLCAGTGLFAQSWKVKGRVLDAETGEPIPNAKVIWMGHSAACMTDHEGNYLLPVDVVAPLVSANVPGYETLILRTMRASDEMLVFHLRPKEIELESVTIYDQRVEPAFDDPTTHIQDYSFFNDDLLLATWNPKEKIIELKLAKPNGEILLTHPGIKESKGEFSTDCMGNRYLLTEKMAYQIFIDGSNILLLPSKREEFDQYATPCKGMINNSFFVYHRLSDFKELYEKVDGKTLKRELLVYIQDTTKLGYVKDDSILSEKGIDPEGIVARNSLSAQRNAGVNQRFNQMTFYQPNYSPMAIIRGNAIVLCHSENRMRCFSENGDFLKDVPIHYHKIREWARQVFSDEEEQNLYTLTEKKGYYFLHQIDTDSGEIIESWDLEKPFLSHVMVKGGYVYFIYRQSDTDIEKRLWRIKL